MLAFCVVWLWWNRPQKADMTAYVPAESIVYLEASLPDLLDGVAHLNAWQELASSSRVKSSLAVNNWLGRLARWTGLGPAEAVVLSRSQVAASVVALQSSEAGTTLKIKPVAVIVIETHTAQTRMRAPVERWIDRFAQHVYRQPQILSKTINGVEMREWISTEGRGIVLSINGSVAVVGNDEQAVLNSVAVQQGKHSSLAGNREIAFARGRLGANSAPLFGFVSPGGLGQLIAAQAPFYLPGTSNKEQARELLARMAASITGSAAWSAGFVGGGIEDRYFMSLPAGMTANLRGVLGGPYAPDNAVTDLLPPEIYSFTEYNLLNPEAAWRGLNAGLSSQLDALGAIAVTSLLRLALKQYGIEDADLFFSAVGPRILTARLDQDSARSVVLAQIRDREKLRKLARDHLGADATSERIGDADLIIAQDEERGAAGFAGEYLLMGPSEDVRRCLSARAQAKSLSQVDAFARATQAAPSNTSPAIVTFSRDEPATQAFVSLFSNGSASPPGNSSAGLNPRDSAYAVSATELTDTGLERTTRSSVGLIGSLAVLLAPEAPGQ